MKKYFEFLLLGIFIYLIQSCASIAPPKGGEKDTSKPRVQKTFPKNGTVNFKGRTIKYYFSEWVQEDKLREQIIITPNVNDFEVKVAKNILSLKFDSNAFKPNTTYNINLRDGIKDLTEGTRSDSTSLVFSTGSFLDSLIVEGKVIFGENNLRSNNITVALFAETDTFNLDKQVPLYSTKTDSSSKFSIQNIKPGQYYLYCFKDENSNSKYDKNKEPIGYLEDKINLTSSLSITNINIFLDDYEKPRIILKENKKKSLTYLEYNKSLVDFSISSSNTTRKILPYVKDKSVALFTDKVSSDSVKLILKSLDTKDNYGADTLGLILNYVDTSKCFLQCYPSPNSQLEPMDSIEIVLSKPYVAFNPLIAIKNGKEEWSSENLKDKYTIRELPLKGSISIHYKGKWNDTVRIIVYPKAFVPISGYIKDTLKALYTKKDAEKYGSIGGSVNTDKNNILVQLLSKDNKVIRQIDYKKDFLFEYLNDGEYKIRVVVDDNRNRKWDQGNYKTRKMPEAIYHYTDPIKLKSNWEILDLKISF